MERAKFYFTFLIYVLLAVRKASILPPKPVQPPEKPDFIFGRDLTFIPKSKDGPMRLAINYIDKTTRAKKSCEVSTAEWPLLPGPYAKMEWVGPARTAYVLGKILTPREKANYLMYLDKRGKERYYYTASLSKKFDYFYEDSGAKESLADILPITGEKLTLQRLRRRTMSDFFEIANDPQELKVLSHHASCRTTAESYLGTTLARRIELRGQVSNNITDLMRTTSTLIFIRK